MNTSALIFGAFALLCIVIAMAIIGRKKIDKIEEKEQKPDKYLGDK